MKKYLLLAILCSITIGAWALDPLFVHSSAKQSEDCSDKDVTNQELSLLDLIQLGICNNPSLRAQYMGVKSAEASVGISRAEYLPSVVLSGQGNITGERIEGQNYVQNEPYSGTAAASWLLFDWGGRTSRAKLSRAQADMVRFTYDAQLQDFMLSVQTAYLNVLAAKESLVSAQASLDTYNQSYNEAQKRYKLGMVSLSDELQTKTKYEQALLAVVLAENSLNQAQGNLAVLLNLPPNTPLQIETPIFDDDFTKIENDNVEQLMQEALANRPEMRAQESAQQAAKFNLYNTRTQFLPSIYANASATYGDNWKHSSPYRTDTAAGLSVSMPLFTGFANTYATQSASYAYKQAQANTQNTRLQIQNDVWNKYQNYKTAGKAYDISKTVLESAEENERVAFRYYKVGKSDTLNLLTAVAQLADARQNKITAFYDLLLSKASLQKSIGKQL
ncbi:MAG: TolC family protein [Elusimicrobiaceae bacterium]|nr:TolC family protein [Elusimicrobiaceae bacterium]